MDTETENRNRIRLKIQQKRLYILGKKETDKYCAELDKAFPWVVRIKDPGRVITRVFESKQAAKHAIGLLVNYINGSVPALPLPSSISINRR